MKVVAYYRVSTARQGDSGLGLEAQEAAVQALLVQKGGEQVGRFVEVESGRKSDRPELARAIALAKQLRATLVIAKADRLARSVAFIATILESGLEVIAADMPSATRFEWHIRAAMAEEEARAISARTKAALGAAKARGVALGWAQEGRDPEAHRAAVEKGCAASAQVRGEQADSFAEGLRDVLAVIGQGGSLRDVAAELNAQGILTPRGGQWSAMQVKRVKDRLALA